VAWQQRREHPPDEQPDPPVERDRLPAWSMATTANRGPMIGICLWETLLEPDG